MKKIIISIINFNGAENTEQCLISLNSIDTANYTVAIVVIDNASQTPFVINKAKYPNISVTLLEQKTNLGFAGGHNIGIQYAMDQKADYIVILNNDTYVQKDFLAALVKPVEADEKVAVVSPKIYFAKGSEFHKDRYTNNELGIVFWYAGGKMDWDNVIGSHRGVDEVDKGQFDITEETEFGTGCCLLLRVNVLENSGVFDDRYFLYYEDSDLQERIKRMGYTIYYAPKSVLWHKNAGSSGGSGSILQDYYISRNRLLFGYLYAPLKTKFALLRESVSVLFTGRVWQKKGVKDFYLKKFGKGSFKSE